MQDTSQMSKPGAAPMPQPVILQPGQHVQTLQQPPTRQPSHRFRKAIFGLGIAEVVVGSIIIIFGIAAVALASDNSASYYYYYYGCRIARDNSYISQGIWCGLLTLATGILGIIIRKKTSRCMYIANMAMGIITATVVFGGFVISSISASASVPCSSALVALHVIVALLCFAVLVLTILHASFCCSGVCAPQEQQNVQNIKYLPQYQNIAHGQPHYVQGPDGQLILVTSSVTSSPQMAQVPIPQYVPQSYANVPAAAPEQEIKTA